MGDTKRIADRYELGSLLGRGAMGEVYRGRDVQTGDAVAIKLLRPHLIYQQPELIERFRREGEALRKLNHPNVVKVLAAVEADDLHYLVMEYVDGGTLADLLKRQPQLPVDRALAIALELADALTRTHHLNIVHRDIKPANILIAEDGTPRLTDFGLALSPDEQRLTQPGMMVGTWLYLSPEVCAGATPDVRSDVWSFGVTFYEMLAGRPPFVGDSLASIVREITTSPLLDVAELRDDVPPELNRLVRRMLMKDAVARIASFRQIGAALEAIAAGKPVAPTSAEAEQSTRASHASTSVQIEVQWSDEAPAPAVSAQTPARDSTPRLLTKLVAPPMRPQLIVRERLLKMLDEGLRQHHSLTLVSAPAGFGKTTLVDAWLQASREIGARPYAWFTLDTSDNDPAQFFQYLVAAFTPIDAGIGVTTGQLLQLPKLPAIANLLTPLINDIAARCPLALVLDDYHTITAAPIHDAVRFLLDHMPQGLHVVILTREELPFSLARLRVRNQVTEVHERDLRFNAGEAAAFLNDTMRLDLTPDDVEQLMTRTEGWIAALQLAALAILESPEDAHRFVAEFTGDNRYVMDYLLSEVLEQQTPEVRSFLRQTSILDRLTAPLCDAVTGATGSRELLERLAHANLFVIPLDGKHTWYRYHQLFADVLRQMLTPAETAELHRRAVPWFEAQGAGAEAIAHALAAASVSTDYSDALRLIGAHAETCINDGRMTTVLNWLAALPDAAVRANTDLATYKAWALVMTGDLQQADDYVAAAQTALGTAQPGTSRSKLGLVQSFITLARGDFENTALYAREALAGLPAQHPWRVIALWALAEAQERSAPIADAIASLREACGSAGAAARTVFAAMLDVSLASALNLHGKRREALAVCRQSLTRFSDTPGRPAPLAVMVLARLAVLYYEANDLAQASDCLRQGQALAGQLALDEVSAMLDGLTATLHAARGEMDAALSQVQRALQHAPPGNLSDVTWISAIEARVHLRRGDVLAAQRWADAAGLSLDDSPGYMLVEQHCAYAWLLMAQGRLTEAAHWLAQLEQFVIGRGYTRWQISVRVLQALVAEYARDTSRANVCMAEAVQLAAPEGYRRAFLDEDPRVMIVLRRVRARAPDFVDALLHDASASPVEW